MRSAIRAAGSVFGTAAAAQSAWRGWGLGVLAVLSGCASTPASLRNLDSACNQGSRVSCSRLGIAYYEGKDEQGGPVTLDFSRARQSFDKGCQRGLAESCYLLGSMYLRGEGGPVDASRGVELWRRACELGDGQSCRKTAEGYLDGSISVKSRDLASVYAKQGCEQKDKPSCVLWKQLGGRPPVSPKC